MTTTVPSTDLVVPTEPLFTCDEQTALVGFLAGYSGLTWDAYVLGLRRFTAWCQQRRLHLFQARRADIECLGRDLESRGRARSIIARRLCTISGFYRCTWLLFGWPSAGGSCSTIAAATTALTDHR